LAPRAEADEVAQEAFLRLYRHIATIDSDAHLRAWLVRVTTHLAIDRLRQRPEQPDCTLETVELAAVEDPADPLLAGTLRRLLATLPTAARAVLVLRYQQDLDPTDIAHTLDMPLNTVKSHLKRSLDHLRQRLRGQAPVLGEPLDER
jgi:RNA polymerase sigma-70 factor (ECF subfamily)